MSSATNIGTTRLSGFATTTGDADHLDEPGARAPAVTTSFSFEEVYAEHHDFVWRNVRRLGVPSDAADDALQDVFIVVSRKLSEFAGRSSVRTWLFAIMVRVVRDIRRGNIRRERLIRRLTELPSGPNDSHARSDAARILHQWLRRLDERKRVVFIMSELEGMTGPEISDVLGLKLPAVYARIRAARQELAKMADRERARAPSGTRA